MRALWVSLAIVVADQIVKVLVKSRMILGESIPVIGDWLKWTFTENPGMAFGIEFGGGDAGKLFLTVFSVVATVLIVVYLARVREAPAGYRYSLAFILGGALGNVIDRVFYGVFWDYAPLGYGKVVDFFHLDVWRGVVPEAVPFFGGKYIAIFPIGNIADLAIIAGIVGILLTQGAFHRHLVAREEARKAAREAAMAPAMSPGAGPVEAAALGTVPPPAEPHTDAAPPPVA